MASKLGEWLATRNAEQLAEVLARRPDVTAPPAPRHLADLVDRLMSRPSVTAAFHRLPRPAVQLVEVLQAFGGPLVAVEQLAAAIGREPDDPDLVASLEVLALRALVWPDASAGGDLRMAGPLWSAFRHPLHLGPPAERLYSARTVGDVGRYAATLGVATGKSKQRLVDDLVRWVSDAGGVRAEVATAPEAVRALLSQVAWDGPVVTFVNTIHGYGQIGDPVVEWALSRGLLVADGWQAAVMPGEVGMALRGTDWRAPFTPRPPEPSLVDAPPEAVGQEAAAAAGTVLAQVGALLEACAATPVTLLRAGGVGSRELKRLTKAVGCDERTVRLWLEVAYVAGLVGPSAEAILPTQAYDDWCAAEPADRLAPLLRAWWRLPTAPYASTGVGGHSPAAALTFHFAGDQLCELRQEVLHAVATLPPGSGVTSGEQLAEAVAWRVPMLVAGFTDVGPLVAGLWQEAVALGAVALGALTPLGRAVLTDDSAVVVRAARGLLPDAVPTALFQADLTAVVPGAPTAPLARLLDSAAERESAAGTGAAIWRFHPASVRRALDSGQSPADLLAALRDAAGGAALPQPLEYLIGDVARRHGQVRVRGIGCVLHAEDPALLAEIVAARSLTALRLALLAPTVLVSAAPPAETLAALRAAGYAPVGEAADGEVLVELPARKRAPRPPRVPGVRRPTAEPPPVVADLPALATKMLASPGAATAARPAKRNERTVRARGPLNARPLAEEAESTMDVAARVARGAPQLAPDQQRLLVDAVAHNAPVTIRYTNASGSTSTRIIEPSGLQSHLLEAFCYLRDDERMFALDRIDSVAPAGTASPYGGTGDRSEARTSP